MLVLSRKVAGRTARSATSVAKKATTTQNAGPKVDWFRLASKARREVRKARPRKVSSNMAARAERDKRRTMVVSNVEQLTIMHETAINRWHQFNNQLCLEHNNLWPLGHHSLNNLSRRLEHWNSSNARLPQLR